MALDMGVFCMLLYFFREVFGNLDGSAVLLCMDGAFFSFFLPKIERMGRFCRRGNASIHVMCGWATWLL